MHLNGSPLFFSQTLSSDNIKILKLQLQHYRAQKKYLTQITDAVTTFTTAISLRGHVDFDPREKSSRCHSKLITSLEPHSDVTELTGCYIPLFNAAFPEADIYFINLMRENENMGVF